MAGADLLRLIMVQLTLGTAVDYLVVFFQLMVELAASSKMTRPRFEYEGTYARRAVIIVIILFFGPFVPLLFVLGAIYMFITFVVERWLIMFFYRKSPSADDTHIRQVVFLFYGALVLYPFTTLLLFMELNFLVDPYILVPFVVVALSAVLFIAVGIAFDKTGDFVPAFVRKKPDNPHEVSVNSDKRRFSNISDSEEVISDNNDDEIDTDINTYAKKIAQTYRHPYHDAYDSIPKK